MSKKPKPTYLFLTLHKAYPSPTPVQNLKNHHKLHNSSILTPQKRPQKHRENNSKNSTSPYPPKKTLLKPLKIT